jgi:hypothetical protein
MKKVFAVFLMASVLALVALPVLAVDSTIPGVDPTKKVQNPEQVLPQGPTTGTQLISIIEIATNWIFAIFTVLTIIFVLLAAFQFVTAGGDAAKVGEARQKLIWASVGIVVALASKGLVPVVKNIVGG